MYERTILAQVSLNGPVTQLKYIGPYLAQNLMLGSYDPQTNLPFSVETLADLASMIRGRSSRNPDVAKLQLREWLHHVLRNERAEECLPVTNQESNHITLRNGQIRTYKIQYWNRNAEKSIIDFWRYIANGFQLEKIPNVSRLPTLGRRYPEDCLQAN